ncbi:hypothetical protein ACU4GR_33100, partial [Methylobacterium oryzae CBMB20]
MDRESRWRGQPPVEARLGDDTLARQQTRRNIGRDRARNPNTHDVILQGSHVRGQLGGGRCAICVQGASVRNAESTLLIPAATSCMRAGTAEPPMEAPELDHRAFGRAAQPASLAPAP